MARRLEERCLRVRLGRLVRHLLLLPGAPFPQAESSATLRAYPRALCGSGHRPTRASKEGMAILRCCSKRGKDLEARRAFLDHESAHMPD